MRDWFQFIRELPELVSDWFEMYINFIQRKVELEMTRPKASLKTVLIPNAVILPYTIWYHKRRRRLGKKWYSLKYDKTEILMSLLVCPIYCWAEKKRLDWLEKQPMELP